MLGGWVNPHREQQSIPQGQTSITHSHELQALPALAQHISHSHSGIDEKRPTENVVNANAQGHPRGRATGQAALYLN